MSASSQGGSPDIALRLDRLPDADRNYLIQNLPLHLDHAADPRSVERLLQLARDGFPQLETERTHDPAGSSEDYRYYFRAALRARDLSAAMDLGCSRASLSHLSDWLVSGVLADCCPIWVPDRRYGCGFSTPSLPSSH